MSTALVCPSRTLISPRCPFKLYGQPLGRPAELAVRRIAATWIADPTAGFIISHGDDDVAVHWWEAQRLHRIPCGSARPSRRPEIGGSAYATASDLAVIAFEATSWTRHVLGATSPTIPAYLAEHAP